MTDAASTAIVKVTPISGGRQEWAPACYLLEIDQAKILLDAGASSTFDMSHLAPLKRIARNIDLILLSHGDLAHCGGLPYILSTLNLTCPILATLPVHHMGLVSAYDAYQSYIQAAGCPPSSINLDELDAAFERITMLRYSQSYTVPSGNAMGIQVTPIAAGHTLGGAMWRIRKHTEEIFYAMDFNHKREGHLDGAALELVQRPSLLIADAKGALEVHVSRKQRDSELLESILSSVKAGGSVLLPVDTAGRSLELLQTIDTHWNNSRLSYPVIFLSHQSKRVVDLAKGMLEWMNVSLTKIFEQDRTNPFELKHIKIVHSIEEVKSLHGPKVILASLESLDTGMSRALLADIVGSTSSSILFVIKSDVNSLAAKLLNSNKGTKINVTWAEEVPLEGEELQKYRREAQEAIERRAAEAAFAELERQREDEEESEDGVEASTKRLEQEQIASAVALQHVFWTDYKHDWFASDPHDGKISNSQFYPLIPPETALNSDGTPNRYQSFPFREPRRIADDYGELVDFNEFNREFLMGGTKEATVPTTPSLMSEPKALQIIAPLPATSIVSSKDVPMKWVMKSIDVILKCTCKLIDFSGISDGRSLKTIYSRIAPRRLVLVGGSAEATEYLTNHFAQTAVHSNKIIDVYSPYLGENITVCSAVNVIPAVLSESLISKLDVHLLGEYEIAWVNGLIESSVTDNEELMNIDRVEDEDEEEEQGALKQSSPLVITANPNEMTHHLVLGDLRLGEIRRMILTDLKLSANFISGDLVCGSGDRRISIKKDPSTAILYMEGPICAEYYSIRQILYSSTVFLS